MAACYWEALTSPSALWLYQSLSAAFTYIQAFISPNYVHNFVLSLGRFDGKLYHSVENTDMKKMTPMWQEPC